ncbi:hypothetical protein E1263_03325 [Kribbella antibiotica]|uniref:Uncharacterized protein n=1 Tax=Kribbella antibiotica TaxID=190195 RepID=A0A4R4ZTR1_9ACTN|nr:hypothetical protein [Kribbella antibiotica]TDD62483.1 hypothetical protein E1263_03325 [Kribbella antibiotica]
MEWSNVTWFLTALGAVVVLLTRVRLGAAVVEGTGRSSGAVGYSAALLRIHTTAGVLTLLVWIVALVTGRREIALLGLAGWWLLAVVGLLLLARWLPSGGKHSEHAHGDSWGSGAGLSLLGHVGVFLGAGYFTWVTLTDRL